MRAIGLSAFIVGPVAVVATIVLNAVDASQGLGIAVTLVLAAFAAGLAASIDLGRGTKAPIGAKEPTPYPSEDDYAGPSLGAGA
jgi:hypothetical protein